MATIRTIAILLLIGPQLLIAQVHLRGRVIDASTQEAIVGALVTVSGAGDTLHHRELTNRYGSFDFLLAPGPGSVVVHSLGYGADTLHFTNPIDSLIVRLHLDRASSEQVIVTALRHNTSEQEAPVSLAVVRGAEVESRNPGGLDKILRYIPGLTVMEDQLSIRGSSGYSSSVGARILLMLDGMPFLSADNGDMKFDAFPLIAVDRVEVVKGAGSALYGSSAFGGVVNVLTREPSEEGHLAVNLFSGIFQEPSYDQWKVPGLKRRYYSAEVGKEGSVDGIRYLLTGAYKRNESYRFGNDSYAWNTFLKIIVPLNALNKLTVSGLAANENHGGWLYWRSLSEPLMASDSLAAINARVHSFKSNIYANWQSFIGENVVSTLKVSNFYTDFTTDPRLIGDTAGQHSFANNTQADFSATWTPSPVATLTAGVAGSLQKVSSDLFQNRSGKLGAIFAQFEWMPIAGLTLIPGLRGDLIKYDSLKAESQLSPKFGIAYHPIEMLALRASYGSGFRAPTISERFISTVYSGFQVRPNLSLVPERSTSFEVGANLDLSDVLFDAALFYSRYRDLIEPGFVTELGKTIYIQFRNLSDAFIAGHEEHVRFKSDNIPLVLDLNYTYIYPENSTTHQILQFRPRHVGQINLSTHLAYFTAGMDFRYISAYETMDSVLSGQITDGDKRVDTKVLDARLGATLGGLGVPGNLVFQVQNILNYNYVEVAGNLAPPRNYSLRLELMLQ